MKILENFEKILRYKNDSDRTIQMYLHYTEKFLYKTETYDAYKLSNKTLVGHSSSKTTEIYCHVSKKCVK